ncbi:hypothetical protein ACLOJK_026406 [Asimina triloba]
MGKAKQMKTEESKTKSMSCSFNLPTEVLELIISQLSFKDRIRLATVCKSWQLASLAVTEQEKRPLFIALSREGKRTCRIYDPWSKELLLIHNLWDPTRESVACSAYGWLLLVDHCYRHACFLHPFSRARIQLPDLEMPISSEISFTFSSSPTSPACIVFSTTTDSGHVLCISICRFGESTWTYHRCASNLSVNSRILPWFFDSVFHNDILYFLTGEELITFDASTRTWKISNLKAMMNTQTYQLLMGNDVGLKHLCKFEGELFFIIQTSNGILTFKMDSNMMMAETDLPEYTFIRFILNTMVFINGSKNIVPSKMEDGHRLHLLRRKVENAELLYADHAGGILSSDQKKHAEDAYGHLARIIMNKRFRISGQADDEYDFDGAPSKKKSRKKERIPEAETKPSILVTLINGDPFDTSLVLEIPSAALTWKNSEMV